MWRAEVAGACGGWAVGASHDDALADGVQDDLRGAVHVRLFHNVRPVRFDGPRTHVEQHSNVLVAAPLGNELKHLTFSLRQRVEPVRDAARREMADVVVQQDFRYRGAEERLAPRQIRRSLGWDEAIFNAVVPELENLSR